MTETHRGLHKPLPRLSRCMRPDHFVVAHSVCESNG